MITDKERREDREIDEERPEPGRAEMKRIALEDGFDDIDADYMAQMSEKFK